MSKKDETSQPPQWTTDQFAADALASLKLFKAERSSEPLEMYGEVYENRRDVIDNLLEATIDLTDLRAQASEVLGEPGVLEVLRYIAAPPISEDDLRALTDVSLAASRLKQSQVNAEVVVDAILQVIDTRRFPWLKDDREATPQEREVAAISTAALLAAQRVQTERRRLGGKALERAVGDQLEACGFTRVKPRTIKTTDDAPGVGEFCGESKFGSRKADLVVRLYDRRIMPIECKQSNSSTNSVKRLNNDAAAKAVVWQEEFGSLTAVPAAALSGVFNVLNLEQAQTKGLNIFWGHNLKALTDFVCIGQPPQDTN